MVVFQPIPPKATPVSLGFLGNPYIGHGFFKISHLSTNPTKATPVSLSFLASHESDPGIFEISNWSLLMT
jgi:hypothetical protein